MKNLLKKIIEDGIKNRDKAEEYLAHRGLKATALKDLKIGYLTRLDLSSILAKKAIYDDPNNQIRLFEHWQARVVFPLYSVVGDLIAIVTREVNDKAYSTLYDHEKVYLPQFYGMDFSLEKIWKTRTVILTEGIIDLLSVKQVFPNLPILAMNTKTINARFKIFLERYAQRVILLFDRGTEAIYKSLLESLDVDLIERFEWKSDTKSYRRINDMNELLKLKGEYILKKMLIEQFPNLQTL